MYRLLSKGGGNQRGIDKQKGRDHTEGLETHLKARNLI